MKKVFGILILFLEIICLVILCLGSCIAQNMKHRFYFVEGKFLGINKKNTEEIFYFIVSEISENEYKISKGINVVNDVFKKKYYMLELYYIIGENNEKNYITFSNLRYAHYNNPTHYEDDNGYTIVLFSLDGSKLIEVYRIYSYSTDKVVKELNVYFDKEEKI